MTQIGKPERKEILNKLAATVEKRFYDPNFDSAAWRAKVEQQGTPAVDAQSVDEFVLALDRLVRSVGTPDSGFFHEARERRSQRGFPLAFSTANRMSAHQPTRRHPRLEMCFCRSWPMALGG